LKSFSNVPEVGKSGSERLVGCLEILVLVIFALFIDSVSRPSSRFLLLNVKRLKHIFPDFSDFAIMAFFSAIDDYFLPRLSWVSCYNGVLLGHGCYEQPFHSSDDALYRIFEVYASIFIEDEREIPWAVKIVLNLWWELVFKVSDVWLR
jgi:hypothetical protein